MNTQRELAWLAYGQKMKEREMASYVNTVRIAIADGDAVPSLLRNAVTLPVAVLALPRNRERFMDIYCEWMGDRS